MLILIVMMVGVVGYYVNLHYTDNWRYIGQPFLISTVALGGATKTLPFMYSRIKPTKKTVWWYRAASLAGLFMCFLLISFWCLFVLRIVPQQGHGPTLER